MSSKIMQKTGDLTDSKRGSQDQIKQKILECVNESDSILSYRNIHNLFQQFQKQQTFVLLSESEEIQIIKSCKSLSALGYLHKQEQIKLSQRESQFRENIRQQIDELQQQNLFKKAFLFDNILECKSNEEFEEISNIMKTILNVLIVHGSDSFHFIQISDIVISALLLTANNRTIGRDHFLLQILDTLQRLLETAQQAYLWTIVLEQIINASTIKEAPQDYVQPNLVARIMLAKIPFMEDLFKYLGRYLGKCYKFQYKMFDSMLMYGVTQQALELILKLSNQFLTDFQMEILEDMRKNLVPVLIKYMRNLDCFDQIQNLFLFFLISPIEQISQKDLDYKSLQEIISNYDQNFDKYKESHAKRIGNFIFLVKGAYKSKPFKGIDELEKKLRSKFYISTNQQLETVQRQEQFSFWMDDNQFDQKPAQKKTIVGLRNLLNTCYLNSFIQALFWTLDFRKLIMEDFQKEDIKFLKPMSLKTNFLRCFIYLDSMTEEIDFTPLLLKRSLREPYRTDVRQQDAGEFGAHLFEDMEKNFEKEEYQKIKSLFCGVSKSTFKCFSCNTASKGPDEEFMMLTLNFDNEKRKKKLTEDVEQMLGRHLQSEQIQYTCENCKMSSALNQRSLEFSNLSNNIIFQINRFEFQGGKRSKISEKVNLKSEIQVSEGTKKLTYELYAIIIHLGPMPDAGHYTAYCKANDIWYKFDDNIVTKLDSSFERVQRNFKDNETPYLLFFRRQK